MAPFLNSQMLQKVRFLIRAMLRTGAFNAACTCGDQENMKSIMNIMKNLNILEKALRFSIDFGRDVGRPAAG